MTAPRLFVKAANGLVHITNPALDFDEVENLLAEYRAADDLASQDYYARRWTHHDHVTRPAADNAADDVRDAAGFQLDWEAALALSDEIARAASDARKQQQARLSNPLLKGA